MDLLIQNGDLCVKNNKLVQISNVQEILQRVFIRLVIKKGSFVLDPSLGSELHNLKNIDKISKSNLLNIVSHAIAPIKEVALKDLSLYKNNNDLFLHLILSINNQTLSTDILIS